MLEIVQSAYHSNGRSAPFVVAIVDDPYEGDTKVVITFGEEGLCAVLSLDVLCQEEDISVEQNGWKADKYDSALREKLWLDEDTEA